MGFFSFKDLISPSNLKLSFILLFIILSIFSWDSTYFVSWNESNTFRFYMLWGTLNNGMVIFLSTYFTLRTYIKKNQPFLFIGLGCVWLSYFYWTGSFVILGNSNFFQDIQTSNTFDFWWSFSHLTLTFFIFVSICWWKFITYVEIEIWNKRSYLFGPALAAMLLFVILYAILVSQPLNQIFGLTIPFAWLSVVFSVLSCLGYIYKNDWEWDCLEYCLVLSLMFIAAGQKIYAFDNQMQTAYFIDTLGIIVLTIGGIMRIFLSFIAEEDKSQELLMAKMELGRFSKELEQYSQELEKEVKDRTEKLQVSRQQLMVTDKVASLGHLTAGIAHELKNPLNFIINFSALSIKSISEIENQLLIIKEKLDAEVYTSLTTNLATSAYNMSKILEHGKRADNIVKTMLLHVGNKAAPPQLSDINALLEDGYNLAYHGMRVKDTTFNIHTVKNYEQNIDKVEVVQHDLMRVFLNMFNNSFYSTNNKAKKLGKKYTPEIFISSKSFENHIEIRIRDNGEGVPPDLVSKIFTPFFTTKPAGEGTGLGLSMCYDIVVRKHYGEMKVESEQGNYAEFIINIPKRLPREFFNPPLVVSSQ